MRQLILNSSALIHNFQQVRSLAPQTKIIAMVKANAYGHGLLWTSQHLVAAGADALGVATIDEAMLLRDADIQTPIVLMGGFLTMEELRQALALNLTLVIHEESHVQLLEMVQAIAPISLWIKIDTGMHRLGFAPEKFPSIYDRLKRVSLITSIGFMTHFSDADHADKTKTEKQIHKFKALTAPYPNHLKSLSNSAAIIALPAAHADWVRPGIMLYGASPFHGSPDATKRNLGDILKPVMTVQSNIISMHEYPKGASIGYGGIYTCPRISRIAVVAFGYGDGYPRHVNNSEVLIKNHICTVVGRVSMDLLQVDVTDHPDIQLGEMVTLWGEGMPAENLAAAAGTISYEIFCQLQQYRTKIIYL